MHTTLLTTAFKDSFDLPTTPLPALDGRSRPSWMTHGFTPPSPYENHTESFPSLDVQDPDAEFQAMHAAHSSANLLLPPTPVFPPSTTPIDMSQITPSMTHRTTDISIHKEEAYSALSSAMALACTTPNSRYTLKHPAFTPPKPYHGLPHSPLLGVITRFIEHTHRSLPHLIRVASPNQIRLELETCLLLEFAPYVHSGTFYDDEGLENSVVPWEVFARVEDAVNGEFEGLVFVRDAIGKCEKKEVEDGEEFLGIWEAWNRLQYLDNLWNLSD
ncbi:hypothetical protein GRF29_8g1035532 [Pseudopithomyces chartarum]|uniref:Uncharacterized protein n=1 Tax=Pseudopithomyces chartarum TaxID=1892770 RepID=A0AAN6RLT0_9PLEO|nr:hypothetical protein GRF29_8g1035532 [Pseudopithomyces chartarum]